MSSFRRIATIVGYEWRRALAKKKVLGLLILAIALQILLFVALSRLPTLPSSFTELMWIVGVLSGQSFFIHLISIIIAGGSMAEEYEQGTADILLSKPITRVEYVTGKFLGGFSLLAFIEAVTTFLGVILAFMLFGSQRDAHYAPIIFFAMVYSTLLFFSLTFMLGEVFRKGTLAMLTAFGIFIISNILGPILSNYLYIMTGEKLYLDISKVLPTWSATNFSSFVTAELVTGASTPLQPVATGDVQLAAVIIAIYAIVSIVLAYMKFLKSDVTKRIG
jgi:ABC-2 type transport system permease protein